MDYVCVLAASEALPHWIGMVHIFQPLVWLNGVALCVSVCCIIRWSSKHDNNEKQFSKWPNIILNISGVMVNNIPKHMPSTPRIRFIYLLWLFFCLNWTSAYTSSLITMITTALRGNDEVGQQSTLFTYSEIIDTSYF